MIIVVKPLPACFWFAPSAVFAQMWKRAQLQKCFALQSNARQQLVESRLFPDAELVAGNEAPAILKWARQYQADLIVMSLRKRTIVADRTTQDVAERSPCAVLGVP